jgi:hypothetical protein
VVINAVAGCPTMHNSLSWRNKNKRHAQLIRYSRSCCSDHAFLDRGLLLARLLLNQSFLVVKSSRLTFTEYPCLKLPRICSVFCNHNRLLFSFIIYNRVCNKSNTTSVTCGAGTVYLPEHLSTPPVTCGAWTVYLPEHMSSPSVLNGVRIARSSVFCVVFVDHCLFPFSGHLIFSCTWTGNL